MTDPDQARVNANPAQVGVLATIGSVLAAFFGVQSSRVRVRDFSHGSPILFLGVACLLTAALVLLLYGLVQLILFQAGGV